MSDPAVQKIGATHAAMGTAPVAAYVPSLLRAQLRTGTATQPAVQDEFAGVVLFVDIVGSTRLGERIAVAAPEGAEQLGALLNRYFANVIGIITEHGGDLIRVDGDAAIVVWRDEGRAPPPYLRAAQAAIALRDGVGGWTSDGDERLQHRVSLAAGQLTATVLSCANGRRHFMLAGPPIQTISDLASACQPGEIAIDEVFARAIERDAELEPSPEGVIRLVRLHDDGVGDIAPAPLMALQDPAGEAETLADFVPQAVTARSALGHADWLAEFRVLSAVYIRLADPKAAAAVANERLEMMLATIGDAVQPLGLEVFDIIADDKGVIVKIICGLPPFSHEGNASRALEAALRVRKMLVAAAGVFCPIGIATGRVFCGDIGTGYRREYLLCGPAMNYGARLMQAAGSDVLCDEVTLRATAGYFGQSASESLMIKGKADPLIAYRFSERLLASPQRPRISWDGRLQGRDDELQQIADRLDAARAGIIAVEGEAGAGKSRLLAEIGEAAMQRGYLVMASATHPIEQATAYFAFRPLLQGLVRRPEDDLEIAERLLGRRLQEAFAGHPLASRVALLEDIAPLGLADKGLAPQIAGAARRAGIEALMVELAQRVSETRPLALLIDDLHWIDESSAQLLVALSRRVPQLLIVVGSRPPEAAAALHPARLLDLASPRLRLGRLGRESVVGMVCDLLGVRSIPPRLADFVLDRSEGLPLHAEQLILSLRDQKLIEVDDSGACRIAGPLTAGAVAENLRDLIVSRIDALDPEEQLAVKVASAIGRVFDAETLNGVFPVADGRARLGGILQHLVAARLLVPDAAHPDRIYSFQHIIIQETTYELLSFGQRRPLHRQIAELLERRYRAELQPHVAALAEHWERASETGKAVEYRLQAAEIALHSHANDDVLMHVARIDQLALKGGIGLAARQNAEIARLRGEAQHAMSRFAEAGEQFARCAALSGIRVPSTQLGIALATAGEIARQTAHRCGLVRPVSGVTAAHRDRLSALLHTRFAEHAYFMSNALPLVHGTLTALNRAERVGAVTEMIGAYGGLAIGLGTAGQFRLANFYRDRSIDLAERQGGLQDRGFARLLAAVYSFQAGQWREAVAHCVAGEENCQRVGDTFRYQSCCVIHGFTAIMTGDYATADALLGAFGDEAELIENIPVRAWVLSGLAILDMIRGRPAPRSLAWLSGARHESLHRAERLLCDGFEAAARLQAGETARAAQLADEAVANLSNNVSTMGIALFSVCAPAEVHLALISAPDRSTGADFRRARAACRVMRQYAARTRICRPRAFRVEGELALAHGRRRRARALLSRALREAGRLGIPLEEGLCHLALSRAARSQAQREAHQRKGGEILRRLGADPWRYDAPGGSAAP